MPMSLTNVTRDEGGDRGEYDDNDKGGDGDEDEGGDGDGDGGGRRRWEKRVLRGCGDKCRNDTVCDLRAMRAEDSCVCFFLKVFLFLPLNS